MPTYSIKAPDGRTINMTGAAPPTEADIDAVMNHPAVAQSQAPASEPAMGPAESGILGPQVTNEEPGAARRFVQGIDRSTFPTGSLMDPVKAVGHMIAHPIETTAKIVEGGRERMTRGLGKAINVAEGDRPVNVDRTKDSGAVEDIIAGAVPVLGPMAQDMITRASGGDVAGAVGELVGVLGQNKIGDAVLSTGKAAFKGARGAKTPAASPSADVPGSTVPFEGPLTRGEETGSGARLALERVPESSPFAGKWWRPFRSEQQAALKSMGDTVLDSIRGVADSGGDLVQSMGNAIKEAKGKAAAAVSKMYDAIDQATAGTPTQVQKTIMVDRVAPDGSHYQLPTQQTVTQNVGGVRPSMAPLKKFAQATLEELKSRPSQAPAGVVSLLEKVAASPDDVTFADMHGARSDWRAMTRDKAAIPPQSVGIVKKLSSMADESMRAAAKASGKPDVISALDAASAAHQENAFVFNKSAGSKIAKAAVARKDPGAIAALLKQGTTSTADVAAVKAIVPEPMLRAVKAHMVSEILEDAWKPHSDVAGAGRGAVPGAPLAPSGSGMALNGQTLDVALTKLQKSPAAALMSPEEMANLGNVARVARTVTPKASAVLQGFMLGAGSIGSMSIGGATKIAGAAANMMGMSYLITTRAGGAAATAFLRAADAAVKGSVRGAGITVTPELRMAAARLHQLAVEEEKKKKGGATVAIPPSATPSLSPQ